jgi:hypothetical protein
VDSTVDPKIRHGQAPIAHRRYDGASCQDGMKEAPLGSSRRLRPYARLGVI